MKLFRTVLFAWAGILGSAGCATNATRSDDPAVDPSKVGVALFYAEKEEGSPESGLRLYVNAEFLRIDDLSAPDDFILFDRKKRTIYNVATAEKSVSIISPQIIRLSFL